MLAEHHIIQQSLHSRLQFILQRKQLIPVPGCIHEIQFPCSGFHLLARLPDHTQVYPGHDYIETNLGFSLDREPDNDAARAMLAQVSGHDPRSARVTTMAEEKAHNSFLRLSSPSVIARLRESFPDLPEHPDAMTVFMRLRALRDRW